MRNPISETEMPVLIMAVERGGPLGVGKTERCCRMQRSSLNRQEPGVPLRRVFAAYMPETTILGTGIQFRVGARREAARNIGAAEAVTPRGIEARFYTSRWQRYRDGAERSASAALDATIPSLSFDSACSSTREFLGPRSSVYDSRSQRTSISQKAVSLLSRAF